MLNGEEAIEGTGWKVVGQLGQMRDSHGWAKGGSYGFKFRCNFKVELIGLVRRLAAESERVESRMTLIILSKQLEKVSCHLLRCKRPQKEPVWDEVGVENRSLV